MKIAIRVLAALSVIVIVTLAGCASKPSVRNVELENKGTSTGVSTPNWVRTYVGQGIPRLQSQSEYQDMYCIVGEETGQNLQFVLNWADNFSAQQRIGSMLRTTIISEYQAKVDATAESAGLDGFPPGLDSNIYNQQIDSVINAIVNVSYSGAQRMSDWWSLNRRYDPDIKDAYSDSYTAYVLYTIPKRELNLQVARALESSIRADSALYDITIEMARQILENGIVNWGTTN